MVETTITPNVKPSGETRAKNIEENELFVCGDGGLFLRLYDGAISISEGDWPNVYSMQELKDSESYPNFQKCRRIQGTVKIEVLAEEPIS